MSHLAPSATKTSFPIALISLKNASFGTIDKNNSVFWNCKHNLQTKFCVEIHTWEIKEMTLEMDRSTMGTNMHMISRKSNKTKLYLTAYIWNSVFLSVKKNGHYSMKYKAILLSSMHKLQTFSFVTFNVKGKLVKPTIGMN